MADYTGESEEQLLRAAKQYEALRYNSGLSPEARATAEREYNAIGNEFQRRSPIQVTETPDVDIPAFRTVGPQGAGNLDPIEPTPPLDARGTFERLATAPPDDPNQPSGKLALDEAAAKKEAQANATQAPAAQGVNVDELRAAERALVGGTGPQLGVSTTQGNTHQVESKVLPPAWYQALKRYTEEAKTSAIGRTAEQQALDEIVRRGAERRRNATEDFRNSVEQSALREAGALSSARRRIGSAIQSYLQSGPRYESVGTVLKEAPGASGFAGGIGLIMGIIGGAATGQANGFTEAVNQNIERRARIAELASKRQGEAIGMEGEQYRRLDQELGDARATRAVVRALYLEQFKNELEANAARVGMASGDSRLAGLLAQIEQTRLGYLEKAASVVMNQARSEQTVAPIKGEGGGIEKLLGDYTEERRKRGMDVMEGGIRLMKNGAEQIASDRPNAAQNLLFRQTLASPGRWATLSSIIGQVSPGQQAFINGFLQFLQSDAGKQLTDSERAGIASAIGSGTPAALDEFIRNSQTRLDALDRGLAPQYGEAMKLYRLRQQIHDAENPRKLYDVRGVETQPPVTERPPVKQ